jgi:hypothetical protein
VDSIARFSRSKRFVLLFAFAIFGALVSAFVASVGLLGPAWPPAWIACGLFVLTGIPLGWLALCPSISIHETHIAIGRRTIPWPEIRRIDQTQWNCPLAVRLTLARKGSLLMVFPGEPREAADLLGYLRQYARGALIDGVPYHEFWRGEARDRLSPYAQGRVNRYPLLRPEDELEVEQMFEQLRAEGSIDTERAEFKDPEEFSA